MLDKTYQPAEVEAKLYALWESAGLFAPKAADSAAPYCIMMPPPNVTGSLHMGHALTFTVQDTLVRFHRMLGRETLWQPGMDHAGIATQMVVERQLAAEGVEMGRRALGREAFVKRVWEWKEESGGMIARQLQRIGASPDWSRERFTMDEGLSRAVRRAFVSLYRKGLIYRDKRLVNWDCKLQTAVSDLEVQQTETNGHLWHLAYPVEGEPGRTITVATTRPETMLGDTGVAVHPEDERFRELVGKQVILPLVGRRIPIVADEYSDPEKGTGAVKITPAHDFNDFEVGRRHGLEAISILDEHGRVNDNAPEAYRGLDRFEARKRVLADLEAQGVLVATEQHRHMVPHGDRSGTVLEPFLTDQWYCDAATLAKPAIEAVESGAARFVPKQWENTYFEWMRNIQPWCISRQLWWGHQIPAWYGPDGQVFVEESEEAAQEAARAHYGSEVEITRDEDVLDTWFSSGLWPFSTLGWPEQTPELARFYPTSVLVTGFDIIFFWVARMMMMGLEFMGEVPFREIYIHGLVRDEKGAKMSKSKGNVIDPLGLIDRYGADALRVSILASTAQGRDIKFGESRVEGYRNFVTKLWNAARFIEMNEGRLAPGFDPAACRTPLNRWIVGETAKAAAAATEALRAYRFNEAALGLYHFTWSTYCDWYVELAKPLLASEDEAVREETRATAGWVLAQILHLLHPMAPFVTEELWARLFKAPGGMLAAASWPMPDRALVDEDAEAELSWLTRAIGAVRAARTELNVPPGARLRLLAFNADATTRARLERHGEALARLARLGAIEIGEGAVPGNALQVVVDEATFAMPVADVVDLAQEAQRLRKEIARLEGEIGKIEQKLANPKFVERAPAEVVEEQRERQVDAEATRDRLAAALARIA
ncbi:valine--tRNA ligase [Marinimicrococcus flavescens]|uniref:Valine--tRNA ligase n=1 Tax=Marinimicrococcus flavescens TaxID=3031815 RepID=A0AAP3XRH4_9PROT|nr:valine--tRNA ligase [Marinimicrococcus flavescens]